MRWLGRMPAHLQSRSSVMYWTWVNVPFYLINSKPLWQVRGGVLPWEEPVNALSWANATTSAPYNLVKTAFAVRQSFIHSREPSFQAACLLAVRQLWRRAADEEEKVDFTPQPGNLVLNSSWRFVVLARICCGWCSVQVWLHDRTFWIRKGQITFSPYNRQGSEIFQNV